MELYIYIYIHVYTNKNYIYTYINIFLIYTYTYIYIYIYTRVCVQICYCVEEEVPHATIDHKVPTRTAEAIEALPSVPWTANLRNICIVLPTCMYILLHIGLQRLRFLGTFTSLVSVSANENQQICQAFHGPNTCDQCTGGCFDLH